MREGEKDLLHVFVKRSGEALVGKREDGSVGKRGEGTRREEEGKGKGR